MNKLSAALAALRYGSSLTDPAAWKRRQTLVNALVGLLGAVAVFLPTEMSHEDIAAIAGGIAAVVGLFNAYVTTASSTKVGLPDRRPPADRPADGADGDGPDDHRIEP